MSVSAHLIPSKFVLLACHTITTIIVLQNRRENVVVNFADQSISVTSDLYVEAENSLLACIALTFLCLLVEFVMIFHGGTMFYDISNFAVLCLHAVGVVLYSQFVIESWPYYELWYYWAGFVLVPTLLEIIAYCFGSIVYGTAISRKPSRKGI